MSSRSRFPWMPSLAARPRLKALSANLGSFAYHRWLRVERLEDRRLLAAAGDLDPTFDGDGMVTTPIGTGSTAQDAAYDVAFQSDGKIVVAGSSGFGIAAGDFAVVRYHANGSLDTSFSGDGTVTTEIGNHPSGSNDVGYSVAIQSDGKIVVAGSSYNGDNYDVALLRYNTDGSPDMSFSGDGKVITNTGSHDDGYSMAIQSDGKIIVAGTMRDPGVNNNDFALYRYTADGSLDTSFSSDGVVRTNIGNYDVAYSVAVQPDGKIVVAGNSGTVSGFTVVNDFALARYNADGSLDTTFSGDGMLTTPIGVASDSAWSMSLQADGKIVVAGETRDASNTIYDFAVVRYNSDGSLDTGFDTDGKLTTDIGQYDFAYSVAIQADGRIVVAGSTLLDSIYHSAVARYNSNGSLDATFSGDGKVTIPFGTAVVQGIDVALQTDGKIVMTGTHHNGSNYDIAVARFEANNSPTNPSAVGLAAINEDIPNAGNPGSAASAIVAASDAIDLDGHSLGVAVTAADNANGQWQYSTNGGGSWQNLLSLSPLAARLLAPAQLVRFVPNANFNSQIAATTISFKTWDQTSGTAGSTADTTTTSAFSTLAAQATQPVTPVNDEQVLATNLVLTVGQGASAVITSSVLETTDIDDTTGDLLYTVTSGPSNGNVLVSGTPATQFTQHEINSSLVSYDHDGSANYSESFSFTVDDGEGTASSGTLGITIAYPGDYNRNGIVDSADYVFWRKMLGTTGVQAYSGADGDGNTAVEQNDFGVWRANFGATLPPGAGTGAAAPTATESAVQQGDAAVPVPLETPPSEALANTTKSVTLALFDDRSTRHDMAFARRARFNTLRITESAGDNLLLLLANDRTGQSSRQDLSLIDDHASDNDPDEEVDSQGLADDPLAVALAEWR